MTRSEIAAKVRGFITSNFYVASPDALSDEGSLLDQGLVDSTGVLEIVGFLEESLGVKVADDEMDPVAARTRELRRRGASPRTGRAGQQQAQRTPDHVGEGGGGVGEHGEAETAGVEVDRRGHVVDEVTDTDVGVGGGHRILPVMVGW